MDDAIVKEFKVDEHQSKCSDIPSLGVIKIVTVIRNRTKMMLMPTI